MVVFGSAMAPYLLSDELRRASVLFDMVDVDSDKWRQYAQSSSHLFRWIYAREARKIAKLEREAACAFGKTLLVSPFEAKTFRALAPASAEKIDSLSNGVDLDYFAPGTFAKVFPDGELPIVMTGRMDYRPNVDGAMWFAKQIAPRIFTQLPSAHVYFVGSNPPAALRKLNGSKITVTGAVADVRPYLQGAAAVVAPLRIARGIQNKVLEAMAMQKPVIATGKATRALNVTSGTDLWIANEPRSFADAVIDTIQGTARDQVAKNARTYVEQNHSWNQIFVGLDRVLSQLAEISKRQAATRPLDPVSLPYEPTITGAKA
jgi:sugar transferase (PEP-CTERM/EpsH1 system associated)